jgi:hypothetical protein
VGSLTLPATGVVYVDANPIIYTVEKHPAYGPLLAGELQCLNPLHSGGFSQLERKSSSDLHQCVNSISPLVFSPKD